MWTPKSALPLLLALTLQVCSPALAQESSPATTAPADYQSFVGAFNEASSAENFGLPQIGMFFRNFSDLLVLGMSPDGDNESGANQSRTERYPLARIKNEQFYTPTIKSLLQSKNPYQRMLGFLTVTAAGDNTYNDILIKALREEPLEGAKMWAGYGLIYLGDKHTQELFDFVVENEKLGEKRLMPLYMRLEKEDLRKTAYANINSENPKAGIVAVQSLIATGLSPETDKVIRECITKWRSPNKGFAICAAKELGMGDLKDLLAPYLRDKQLRSISLMALANSPTRADQEFLASLAPAKGKVPADIIEAYEGSTRKESIQAARALKNADRKQ